MSLDHNGCVPGHTISGEGAHYRHGISYCLLSRPLCQLLRQCTGLTLAAPQPEPEAYFCLLVAEGSLARARLPWICSDTLTGDTTLIFSLDI